MEIHATTTTSSIPTKSGTGTGLPVLLAACGFVAFYLATDLITPQFASTSLPLPTDPVGQVRDWFADNPLAAVLMGACQAVSVSFLAWFTTAIGDARARLWGFVAVSLMLLSSSCAWVLAGVAPHASLDTVNVLRQANFLTGGTAHVLALGTFVFLASRTAGFGRPMRILAAAVLVVSVLSLSSLVLYQGAAFILLGRLLAMVWTLSAGVSLLRRKRRGTA